MRTGRITRDNAGAAVMRGGGAERRAGQTESAARGRGKRSRGLNVDGE